MPHELNTLPHDPAADAVEEYLDSRAQLIRTLYRMGGLRSAFSALLDVVRDFSPVVRINATHVPLDFSCVVNVVDTSSDPNLATVFRQAGREPPMLLPERLGEAIFINDLDEYKTPQMLRYQAMRHAPFLQHRAVLRVPLFQDDQAVCVINFWAQEPDAYTPEDLKKCMRLVAPLGEELQASFASVVEIFPLPDREQDSAFSRLEMCPNMEGLRRLITQVASTNAVVLIQGETGVGKEIVAKAVHELSPRSRQPFVAVNCGAIADTLMDSELFGHEKGAFTGAHASRPGFFEQASGGTLFLDEIGDLPLGAQSRLLRVLENGIIHRVGSPKPLNVNVRIIAATHVDLPRKVTEGTFRRDLWYRLSLFPLMVDPLRSRRYDITALARYFLGKKAQELGLPPVAHIPAQERARLLEHTWPGNVRELEHVIARSLILRGESAQGPLVFDLAAPLERNDQVFSASADWPTLAELENRYIRDVLLKCGGKLIGKGSATEVLGIHYTTLRTKMMHMGLPLPRQGRKGEE